jgi:hypothetical protein
VPGLQLATALMLSEACISVTFTTPTARCSTKQE